MLVIDRGGVEIALVVESGGRMVATVSDGDVRRAMLSGVGLDDPMAPHMRRDFSWVTADADRAAVLDVMKARFISQVPVLDQTGRVVALHLMQEMLGAVERPNVAVVMAGGRGTRLQPFTDVVPKPMIRVAGRPLLERIVLHLVGYGIRHIFLAVNYKREVIEAHFGDGREFGCTIAYLREETEEPLGTAGALRLLPADVRKMTVPLLVMNGDLVTQFDVGALLDAHTAGGFTATVGIREYSHRIPFGVVHSHDGTTIDRLEEKPTCVWSVNAGVYALDPQVINVIPAHADVPMTTLLTTCIRDGGRVAAHLLSGDWLDVGRPGELLLARGEAE